MEIAKIPAYLSALLLLSGCTAILWKENNVTEHRWEEHVHIKDNIDSVFQYANLSASVLQGKSNIMLDMPPQGLAFIGEKNIYILTRGQAELISLDKLSAQLPLVSGFKKYDGIRLKLKRTKKNDAVIQFSDTLEIWLNKRYGSISEQDLHTIKLAGFTKNSGRYVKNINIEGVILPRGEHSPIFSTTASLHKKYQIEFYTHDDSTHFHPLNLATNVVLTPLTLTTDIVFLPISLRVLGLISHPPTH